MSVRGLSLFTFALLIGYQTTNKVIAGQLRSVQAALRSESVDVAGVSHKLDLLIESIAGSHWRAFSSIFIFQVALFLLMSVVFGVVIGSLSDHTPQSFILLSKKASEAKIQYEKKLRWRWYEFALAFVLGVISSIVANVIFAYLPSW